MSFLTLQLLSHSLTHSFVVKDASGRHHRFFCFILDGRMRASSAGDVTRDTFTPSSNIRWFGKESIFPCTCWTCPSLYLSLSSGQRRIFFVSKIDGFPSCQIRTFTSQVYWLTSLKWNDFISQKKCALKCRHQLMNQSMARK